MTAAAERDVLVELRELHHPVDEEAEFWADDEHPEAHDKFFPECRGGRACEGHSRTVQVCRECGYDHDPDGAYFRTWPCPTVKALDRLEAEKAELERWKASLKFCPYCQGMVESAEAEEHEEACESRHYETYHLQDEVKRLRDVAAALEAEQAERTTLLNWIVTKFVGGQR